jgi:phage gp36-like protein
MTYATQTDLEERFGSDELAHRTDRAAGVVIDAAVLGRALADADAEIDGYLATRYTLPLASTPPVLNRLACDLARYRLYDDGVPETVRLRYQDAVSLLKRMASGEVQLAGIAAPVAAAGGAGNAVATRTTAKQFDASALAGY